MPVDEPREGALNPVHISSHRRSATELHEDRTPLPRAQARGVPAIVRTGVSSDANMSAAFFRDLRLPSPDFNLEVGSGSHAEQTAGVMVAYEKVAQRERPDWIVVVGDVNSTAACAMVGTKLWIPVIHLEAGLRSGDRRMPEEIDQARRRTRSATYCGRPRRMRMRTLPEKACLRRRSIGSATS